MVATHPVRPGRAPGATADLFAFPAARWHEITASPLAARLLARTAQAAGYPVSWADREGRLWTVSIFCTSAEIDALEAVAGHE